MTSVGIGGMVNAKWPCEQKRMRHFLVFASLPHVAPICVTHWGHPRSRASKLRSIHNNWVPLIYFIQFRVCVLRWHFYLSQNTDQTRSFHRTARPILCTRPAVAELLTLVVKCTPRRHAHTHTHNDITTPEDLAITTANKPSIGSYSCYWQYFV